MSILSPKETVVGDVVICVPQAMVRARSSALLARRWPIWLSGTLHLMAMIMKGQGPGGHVGKRNATRFGRPGRDGRTVEGELVCMAGLKLARPSTICASILCWRLASALLRPSPFYGWSGPWSCIGMVAAELFNAAVESLVDLCQGITTLAASIRIWLRAACEIAAAISLLVGGLVFIPRLWAIINSS